MDQKKEATVVKKTGKKRKKRLRGYNAQELK
jgi:hypothetical protein